MAYPSSGFIGRVQYPLILQVKFLPPPGRWETVCVLALSVSFPGECVLLESDTGPVREAQTALTGRRVGTVLHAQEHEAALDQEVPASGRTGGGKLLWHGLVEPSNSY
jgi:hypothetical protein